MGKASGATVIVAYPSATRKSSRTSQAERLRTIQSSIGVERDFVAKVSELTQAPPVVYDLVGKDTPSTNRFWIVSRLSGLMPVRPVLLGPRIGPVDTGIPRGCKGSHSRLGQPEHLYAGHP